jgi:hypothetical protein
MMWLRWPVCAASSRRAHRRNTSDTVNPYGAIGSSQWIVAGRYTPREVASHKPTYVSNDPRCAHADYFLRRRFASLRIPQERHSEPNCGVMPTGEPGRNKVEDKSRSILAYFACIMARSAYRNAPRTSKLCTCTTRKLTPLPMQHPS